MLHQSVSLLNYLVSATGTSLQRLGRSHLSIIGGLFIITEGRWAELLVQRLIMKLTAAWLYRHEVQRLNGTTRTEQGRAVSCTAALISLHDCSSGL